ncbi:hypothetical protein AAVH_16266 [Aphelenchoides avenae]|nr:hypothetical protein AAVH_16266 [Aphelenchus avenae]
MRYDSTAESWQWMDGRAAAFTYWKPGYPQSIDDAQCARMCFKSPQIGGWVNINCEFVEDTAVICKRQSGEYE